MYYKSFKVNGQEDIDDFMLMTDATYHKYSDITRKDFFAKNYKNNKNIFKTKNSDRLEFEIIHQSLNKIKNLYFTNLFKVDTQILDIDFVLSVIKVNHNFFNQRGELCAILNCNIHWHVRIISY